jgi:hypothetical protein
MRHSINRKVFSPAGSTMRLSKTCSNVPGIHPTRRSDKILMIIKMLKGRRGTKDWGVGFPTYIGPYTVAKTVRGKTACYLKGFAPYNHIYDPDPKPPPGT